MKEELFPEESRVEIRIHPMHISNNGFPFETLKSLPVNLMSKYADKKISSIERSISVVSSRDSLKYMISDTGILEGSGERVLIGIADYLPSDIKKLEQA